MRTRTFGAVVLATATVISLGGVTAAQAHPGLPSSVFDRNEIGWQSWRDQVPTSFQVPAGYLPVDIESDVTAGVRRVGGVFQSNVDGRTSRVGLRMTAAQYATARAQAAADGLRIVDFESFLEGGVQYYAAAWVEDRENLGTVHQFNLTGDQAQAFHESLSDTHLPVDIDAYQTPAGVRFASIWVRNTESLSWHLRRSMSAADFDALTASLGDGYRIMGFDSLLSGGTQTYAGIWVENRNGRKSVFRRDLTEDAYETRWHRFRDEGYRLVGYERYETAGGTRYAGMWRQNSSRPDWALVDEVNAAVTTHRTQFNVPGISVAVMQNGQVRYLRGFGNANNATNEWMDAGHVMRLASTSKAVTGVLTMQLAGQNEITVGNQVRSYVSGLPATHTYTVEQLVSNRGCIVHHGGIPDDVDDTLESTRYGTARAAAMLLWPLPFVSGCNIGDYNYSTPGYTILGAAFEGATGQSVNTLIRDNVTVPLGLDTLRPEDRTVAARRATLYRNDNTVATADQLSWKTLGGGLESSVEDLARYGDLLIRDRIVSQARQDQMWVNTGWSYSYGWNIDTTTGGSRQVDKNGDQLGANCDLLLYPDDGIVVAVMSNRQGGGHSARTLALTIGGLLVD